MGKVNMKNEIDKEAEAQMNGDTSTALALPTQTGMAQYGYHSNEDDNSSLLSMFHLQMAHGVGGLAALGFDAGSLVMNKSEVLFSRVKPGQKDLTGTEPLRCVILAAQEHWEEYRNDSNPPLTFPDWKAVTADNPRREANGEPAWTKDMPAWGSGLPMPTMKQAVNLKLLVRQPKGLMSGSFVIRLAGEDYAIVSVKANKSSYDTIAPVLKLREMGNRNGTKPLHGAWFDLYSEMVLGKVNAKTGKKGNDRHVLKLKYVNEIADETQAELLRLMQELANVTVADDTAFPGGE